MFFEINLVHPFRYSDVDAERFLDQAQLQDYHEHMSAIFDGYKESDANDLRFVQKFNKARHEYFLNFDQSTKIKISSFLLRLAIKLRYEDKMPRTEGGPGRTPGKWWGMMLDELDLEPMILKLSPNQSIWLVEVWNHESVQNAWEPNVQSWVNLFDAEMEKLDNLCSAKSNVMELP